MRKRHDYEDNEDYDTLVGMLSYTKNTREDFKKALSWAVQNGFPIDYSTEGSEYWGIKPRPPLLHETMFYSGYEEETKIILDLGSDVNVQDLGVWTHTVNTSVSNTGSLQLTNVTPAVVTVTITEKNNQSNTN